MWHCPHCGAPQAETARCWVCRRSSTTCSTCRHFRPSLAADLGYCALDRRRRPLTGAELRGCWSERLSTGLDQGKPRTPEPSPAGPPREVAMRGFVPLDEIERAGAPPPAGRAHDGVHPPILMLGDADGWERRTSLFGEVER